MNYYIWAFLVTIFSLLLLYLWFGEWGLKEIKYFYVYFLLNLPLSLLVNLSIKKLIFLKLISFFNLSEDPKTWPLYFLPVINLLAPLTEEAIKILPLLFSDLRKAIKEKKKALISGYLLGFSFGIGEAWYLAFSFTKKTPEYATGFSSFWLLSGFFGERLLAVFLHGIMTATVLLGFYKNFFKYYFLAVSFHYLVNIGPALYQTGRLKLEIFYILFSLTILLPFYYIFRIERKLREETPIIKKEKTLYQKEDLNE